MCLFLVGDYLHVRCLLIMPAKGPILFSFPKSRPQVNELHFARPRIQHTPADPELSICCEFLQRIQRLRFISKALCDSLPRTGAYQHAMYATQPNQLHHQQITHTHTHTHTDTYRHIQTPRQGTDKEADRHRDTQT